MSYRLSQAPKSVKATAANAMQFRDMKSIRCDRGIKSPILDYLREEVRKGKARPFDIALCWCEEDGEFYRVNGKHSSIVAAEYLSDSTILNKFDLYFQVSEYRASSLEDVTDLYCTFDRKQQGRSPSDVYMAFASSDIELSSLPQATINLAAAGIEFSERDGKGASKSTPEYRGLMMKREKAFVLFLNKILSEGEGMQRPLCRAPVVAAMLRTYRKAPSEALRFWELVKNEKAEDRDCPSRELARHLSKVSIVRTDRAAGTKNSGRLEMMVKCIQAWNAWRKGTTTALKYYHGKPIPAAA